MKVNIYEISRAVSTDPKIKVPRGHELVMGYKHLPQDIDYIGEQQGTEEVDVQSYSVLASQRPGKRNKDLPQHMNKLLTSAASAAVTKDVDRPVNTVFLRLITKHRL